MAQGAAEGDGAGSGLVVGTSNLRLVVNVGGTSIKCTMFEQGEAVYDIRILGFGLANLIAYEDGRRIDVTSEPAAAISFAVRRIADYARGRAAASIGQICYRVKYFRPTPLCFEITEAAIQEIEQYAFLQASHSALLLHAISSCADTFAGAQHVAVPDHAGLVGTAVLEVSKDVPYAIVEDLGLFAVPQHGYVVRSVMRMLREQHIREPATVLLCHVGSGVTVSFVRSGILTSNSMLYSSCDGPLMTYRSGTLAAGIMLRAHRFGDEAVLDTLFTGSGIYSTVSAGDRELVSLSELFEDERYVEQTGEYVSSIIGAMLTCIAKNGIPDEIVFAGNILTRSKRVFSMIARGIGLVMNREVLPAEATPEGGPNAADGHLPFRIVAVNEEREIDRVLSSQTVEDIGHNGSVARFDNGDELQALAAGLALGANSDASALREELARPRRFAAYHITASGWTSVLGVQLHAAGPTPVDPSGHTLYVDRVRRFVHSFPSRSPANLSSSDVRS